MSQIFRPYANTVANIVLVSIVAVPFLALGFGLLMQRSELNTGQDRVVAQPVPFSHKHHAGELGIDCRYCHTSVEQSRFAGLPPTHTCMTCHSQLWTGAPMLAPVRRSLAEDTPLHWNRVNWLPDYVYFDHSVHIAKGVGCVSCHGAVHEMPLMRKAAPLTMGWCLDCHRNPKARLQPRSTIFDTRWQPPPDQAEQGENLMRENDVHPGHLTDCSVCHR